jgi:hypothetical protein
MSPRLVILLSAVVLATGCTVTTDLGNRCTLKKTVVTRDANGTITSKTVVDILQSELSTGQDFIAFGVTECEDLTCVRDAQTPFLEPTQDDPEPKALGYCSRACIEGADASACEVTDSTVSKELKDRMGCRSLLLDTATLERLRADDPIAYRQTFGETLSPYFCAGTLTNTGN